MGKEFNLADRRDRREWIAYAKEWLKKELRNNPRTILNQHGDELYVNQLNLVYTGLLGVTIEKGKSWGGKTAPGIDNIHTLRKYFLDIDAAIDAMRRDPKAARISELEDRIDELKMEKINALRECAERIKRLEMQVQKQTGIIDKLIRK